MEIIHIVLGKANPDRMNGVNKVVYQLATRQAAAGQQVSVWGITPTPGDHNYGNRNFETRLFRAYRNPFKVDPALVHALTTVGDHTVFHLHGGWVPVFSSLSRRLQQSNLPFVLTAHGAYNTIAMKRSLWTKRFYFYALERALLRRASRIHCIGESEVAGLRTLYDADKTFLMPYGYEPPAITDKKALSQNTFTIGFMGRLDIHTKGLDLLLDAFGRFVERHPAAALWIVGDSAERQALERRIAASHLEDKVVLWGSKFGPEKEALLAQMDVFVHPSRNEGLPASVLEAAALAIPCIVSEATNLGRYVSQYNGGCVISNDSIDELEKALDHVEQLKASHVLNAMGLNAKRMVDQAFNWDHIVREFSTLYQVA